MTFSAIIAGLFAVSKAIPVVAEYIDKAWTLWIDHQVKDIESKYHSISMQRKALMTSIAKAENDNDRKVLSIVLFKLNNSKL